MAQGTLRVKVVGDDSNLKKKLGGAGKMIGGFAKAGAVAAGALAGSLAVATKKTADYGDMVDKASSRMGVNVKFFQDLEHWASENGIKMADLEKIVGRLTQRIGLAAAGHKKYSEAFQDLGVSIKDSNGNLRETEPVMRDAMKALREVPNVSERAALATELFGVKVARDMMPALRDAGTTLQGASDDLDTFGRMSQEQVAASAAFNDNIGRLQRGMESLMHQAVAPLVSAFNDKLYPVLAEQIFPAIKKVTEAFSGGGLGAALSEATSMITNNADAFLNAGLRMFEGLVQAIPQVLPKVVENVLGLVSSIIDAIIQAIPVLVTAGLDLIQGLLDGLIQALPMILNFITEQLPAVLMQILDALPQILEAGVQILQAVVQGLLQALPEVIEFLTGDFLPTLVDTVIELLPQIIEAGINMIDAIVKGLVQAMPMIIEFVIEMIPKVVQAIIELLPQIIEAGMDLIVALINGMLEAWPQVWGMIIDKGPDILRALLSLLPELLKAGGKIILEVVKGVANAMFALPQKMYQAGKDAVQGLINGAKDMVPSTKREWASLGITALNAFKSVMGIGSPSKEMHDLGVWSVIGLQRGIDSMKLHWPQVEVLTDKAKAAKEIRRHIEAGGRIYEDFAFKSMSDTASRFVNSFGDAFYKAGQQFNAQTPGQMAEFLRGVESRGTSMVPASGTASAIRSRNQPKVDVKVEGGLDQLVSAIRVKVDEEGDGSAEEYFSRRE